MKGFVLALAIPLRIPLPFSAAIHDNEAVSFPGIRGERGGLFFFPGVIEKTML
jgi:hypothetical protein